MIYGKYNALVSGAHLAKHLYLHIFAIRQPIKASRLRAQILPPMTQKKGNTNTTNTPNTTTTIVFVSLTRYILFSQNTHGHGGLKRPISHIGWFFLLVFYRERTMGHGFKMFQRPMFIMFKILVSQCL